MSKELFRFVNTEGIIWTGRRLEVAGPVWLLYQRTDCAMQITVRPLTELEVEEYQRLAGCYPRS
jgi:hypothetical protein